MASALPDSQTKNPLLPRPTSSANTLEPEGLSTVYEVPHHDESKRDGRSLEKQVSITRASGVSQDVSLDSSIGQGYDEKLLAPAPQHPRNLGSTQAAQQAWHRAERPVTPLRNGTSIYQDIGPDRLSNKTTSPRKEKKGGIKNTLRRMFGRRSTRDRISVPNVAMYPRHVGYMHCEDVQWMALTWDQNPEEFITSATDVKAKRIASMPARRVSRASGLSSHPPQQVATSPPVDKSLPAPPPPERPPPGRPERPRRSSVPSLIWTKEEVRQVGAAVTGLGLQTAPAEQTLDAANIGFAVTNGSNPRRRSRSVGAFRESEHRMSPIQWRRYRRRSDEIRYWRASSDLTSLGRKGIDSPVAAQKDDNDVTDEEVIIEEHNGDFNFELQGDTLHTQERIGLEERIVTLEIKLMDFEFALSKMQAEPNSLSTRHPRPVGTIVRQESVDEYGSSVRPQIPLESSPSMLQETPPTGQSQWVKDITPKQRPTSVATTLKPGPNDHPEVPRKESIDRSTRSSLTGLTIDHYTTLITLLRNEQSARQRLEQQVSILQGRIDAMSPPASSHSHGNSISQHPHSRSLSSTQRRQGFVDLRGGKQVRQAPPRSSSYSTNETDTDDDNFHDAYVTPNVDTPMERERGEYERGAFDKIIGVEEGMAF